jgi:hypothetical protein
VAEATNKGNVTDDHGGVERSARRQRHTGSHRTATEAEMDPISEMVLEQEIASSTTSTSTTTSSSNNNNTSNINTVSNSTANNRHARLGNNGNKQ